MSVVEGLALYHYSGCGYCGMVRSVLRDLGVEVEMRSIHEDPAHREALVSATGRQTVPCLRIAASEGDGEADEWMHESSAIVSYLRERFEATAG